MDIRGARPAPRDPGQPITPTSLYDDDRYSASHRPFGAHGPFNPNYDRTLSSVGMGIPNAPSHDIPPPPLPPPRFVPVAGPQPTHDDFYNRQRKQSYNDSFFGGSSESVYGSFGQSWKSRPAQDEVPDYTRRESNTTLTGRDEGYSSLSSLASSVYVHLYVVVPSPPVCLTCAFPVRKDPSFACMTSTRFLLATLTTISNSRNWMRRGRLTIGRHLVAQL